jgi:tetratricopeptide (TPR) repeat protein
MRLYDQLRRDFLKDYTSVFDIPRCLGQPLIQADLQVQLGRAYEAAGQYAKAIEAYRTMPLDENDPFQYEQFTECHLPQLAMGFSRCKHHLGDYQSAIEFASKFLEETRNHPGMHQLVALPLLALAERGTMTNDLSTFCGHSPTLTGAIEVMYKGFVYEDQFNIANKEKNRLFLQELCDKKAVVDGISSRTVRASVIGRLSETKAAGTRTVSSAATAAAASPNNDNLDIVQDVTKSFSQATIAAKADQSADEVDDEIAPEMTKDTRRGTRGKKDRKKKR